MPRQRPTLVEIKPTAPSSIKDAGPPPGDKSPDPGALAAELAALIERGQRIAAAALQRHVQDEGFQLPDPGMVGGILLKAAASLMANPRQLAEMQLGLARDYLTLWHNTARRMAGEETATPVAAPTKEDKRFNDPAWQNDPTFDFIKQSYLLTARAIQGAVAKTDTLDRHTARQAEFYTRQFVNALAPSNFVATNPRVLRATLESGGENLVKGLRNLLDDIERGQGKLAIKMTDTDAFRVGENVATAPGKVVYQNDLMQLIQYAPSTATVYRTPLLIIPPWINKFYILDLKPANSFIRWAVAQGLTVFVISWVNPDQRHADKDFDDYMVEGPLAALDAIPKATGEAEVNVIGYCIGGTLLAAMLAYMKAKNDNRFKSATFFTALVDFREAGELSVFIDDEQLDALKRHLAAKGYLESQHMAQVFNLLRDNDLIWSFVVNNYLLGREPFAFDLLYWNQDSTRMPAKMHEFYLRNMYLENRLVRPGGISMKGVPIDLATIALPVYQISTREDHIAPWKSTYAVSQIYRGPYKFVLAGSGHIAGVVNPATSHKYGYWTNAELPADPNAWLAGAAEHPGSWWPDWAAWIGQYGAEQVPARIPGKGKLKAIEDAPGAYVKVKAVE